MENEELKIEFNDDIVDLVSKNINSTPIRVKNVLEMLKDGKTVAFIARYRKEATGGLDENQIREIDDLYQYNLKLLKRKNDVIRLIEEKGLLTEELKNQIYECDKLIQVEDLYKPFKEKKKTKASEAIKNGLTGLADIMLELRRNGKKEDIVNKFLNDNVKTYDDAIQGAK